MARQFLRFKELKELGVFNDRMDAARKVAAGFPKPYEMSANVIAWAEDEVDEWLASRPRRSPKAGVKRGPKPLPAVVTEAV